MNFQFFGFVNSCSAWASRQAYMKIPVKCVLPSAS